MPRTRRQQAAALVHTKEMPPVAKKNQPKPPKASIGVTPAVTAPPEKAHPTSKAFPISSLDAEKNPKACYHR